MKTTVILSGKPVECEVIRTNPKTIIVRTPDGKQIKRHKVKHRVSELYLAA